MSEITYAQAIKDAMSEEMRRDETVFLMGEDVGLYGGAFGVSVGMFQEFGEERVRDTPISEAAIAGAAAGAAVTGMRPIAEIMFSDFTTIAMDQLVNQAAKMRYMFGGKAKVPMVLRTPGGSGTGAAAQHSQSLEAWFCHVPGLKVVVPSTPYDAKGLLKAAIRDDNPVIFIEQKLLYRKKGEVPDEDYIIELGKADIKREGKDLTIITYGRMAPVCLKVAEDVAKEGIDVEVVDPRTLLPLDRETLIRSAKKTGKVLIVHEAVQTGGFGGEITAVIAGSEAFFSLNAPIKRLGGLDIPIPYCPELEKNAVPTEETIREAVYALMNDGAGSQVKATGKYGGIRAEEVPAHKGAFITPLAKRAAEADELDLSAISGSGWNGRIMMRDVAPRLGMGAETPAEDKWAEAQDREGFTEARVTPDGKEILEAIPYGGVRKIIGDKMACSKLTSPHVYFTQRVDLEKLLELRRQINGTQERKTSVTDYIAKAAVMALQKYPDMNVSLLEGRIIKYRNVNLGIAVAAPNGLIVPVVKNADRKTLIEFSKEAGALFDKARAGKLTRDEYAGGTFTISNLGMFGTDNFTAVINPPEAGILAAGAVKDEPAAVKDAQGNKTIGIKPIMNITLTVDHRLIDGLLAAQFSAEVKRLLENPSELII